MRIRCKARPAAGETNGGKKKEAIYLTVGQRDVLCYRSASIECLDVARKGTSPEKSGILLKF